MPDEKRIFYTTVPNQQCISPTKGFGGSKVDGAQTALAVQSLDKIFCLRDVIEVWSEKTIEEKTEYNEYLNKIL